METSEMTPPLTNEQLDELLEMEKREAFGFKTITYIEMAKGKFVPLMEVKKLLDEITRHCNAIRQLVEEVKAHREETKPLPDRTDPYYFI